MHRAGGQSAVHKFSKQRLSRSASMGEEAGSSGGQQQQQQQQPKKSISEPLTVQGFFGICVYQLMRKPLLVSTDLRAGIYLCSVAVLSVLFDLVPAPRTFLASKYSLLNQVFVKWGWGWTFCALAFFILYTSLVLTARSKQHMRLHLGRLLFGTAGWYICTNAFRLIENASGRCVITNRTVLAGVADRPTCQREHSGQWLGFDISGHVFLLTWCNLIISEEAGVLRDWSRLGDILKQEAEAGGRRLSAELAARMWRLYQRHTLGVRCSAICLSSLCLLWDFMLCLTIVYFHTMPSKLAAVLFSTTAWALVYRVALPSHLFDFVACAPGQSELRFIASS